MKFPAHSPHFLIIIWLSAIAVLLSACGTQPVRPLETPGVSTVPLGADNSELSGSRLPESGSLANATQYLEQAANAKGEERQILLTRATRVLLGNGQYNQAQYTYRQIQPDMLSGESASRYQLIGAKLALLNGNARLAQKDANRLLTSEMHDPDILGDALELLAESDIQLHDYAAALDHFIEAESYQGSNQAIETIRYRVARLLESLNDKQLSDSIPGVRNTASRGWLKLTLLYRESASNTDQLGQRLQEWHSQYPEHSGNQFLSGQFPGGKPARQVALLLPISSKFSAAANAVKSGFLQMQASDSSPQAPLVKIYDIGSIPELASEIYEKAVNEGADFIVGPLGKSTVQNLVETTRLNVPTLLLGEANSLPSGEKVYQFSLSPEQEAAQLAQHAWLDNHRTAVMLYPEGEWGQRVADAYQSQWEQLGGTLLGAAPYSKDQADFSPIIKQLLGIAPGEARRNKLARLLGADLKFNPRKRGDIDYIVLFANPGQGRLIKPQLDFYAGLEMPIYSTSRIYSGAKNKRRDADLNRLTFGDMPWILASNKQIAEVRNKILESGNQPDNLNRLYALGVDAYQLIPYLSAGGFGQPVELQGVTGRLQLHPDGKLQRWLIWAQFRDGEPKLLDNFFGYENANGLAEEKH